MTHTWDGVTDERLREFALSYAASNVDSVAELLLKSERGATEVEEQELEARLRRLSRAGDQEPTRYEWPPRCVCDGQGTCQFCYGLGRRGPDEGTVEREVTYAVELRPLIGLVFDEPGTPEDLADLKAILAENILALPVDRLADTIEHFEPVSFVLGGVPEGTAAPDLQRVLGAAAQHGRDSDPDHEAGDLQECLRAAWEVMTPAQRAAFARDPRVAELADQEAAA